ncbi:MAG: hypothetical protein M1816_004869 [Peltula sp. TS41687]|nr:MAG: hypothetical protein M1816_004869 [Peltula sp. TS41687]
MALNGLDSPHINEAFQTAISEPGGWVLLKYISRDELEVHARGNGGVTDLREAIAGYPELSPLYGFLRFRRRSVLVRYVPKDTSRLIQARVKVHFQPVMEKFTPHDAIFAISEASELKETSLSAACSLHAASGSTSSTTSSGQRRRLGEIAEDVEEGRLSTTNDSHKPLPPLPYEQAKMSESSVSDMSRPNVNVEPATGEAEESVQTRPSSSNTKKHEGVVPLLLTQTLSTAPGQTANASPKTSQDLGATLGFNRNPSRDTFNASLFAARPKIKLGPRPSLHTGRRPHTSSSVSRQNEHRPVSSLPAGIRMAPRRNQSTDMSSRQQAQPQSSRFPISIPVHPTQVSGQPTSLASPSPPPLISPGPTSPGSTASSSSSTLKAAARTPEKEKLMRALELRRKQRNMQIPDVTSSSSAGTEANVASPVDVEEDLGEIPPDQPDYSIRLDDTNDLKVGDDETQTPTPGTELGTTASLSKSSQDLIPSTAGTDDALPSMEGDYGISSTSSLIRDEGTESQESIGENEIYVDDENETMTDLTPKVEVVTASSAVDATGDLSATTEDGENRDPLSSSIDYSPVSSKDSAELSSTQASSISEETYHRTRSSTETRRVDLVNASELSKMTPDPHQNTHLSTERSLHGVETSNEPSRNHMLPTNGVKFVTEVTNSPVDDPMATAHIQEAIGVHSSPTEADNFQVINVLHSTTDDVLEPEAGDKVSGNTQETVEQVNQGSSDSLETKSCAAESPGSAGADITHIHSEERQRPVVDRIRTDVSADNSDDNLLSDDSLMDELHLATVQEAKPVSLGRSPITSTFPRSRDRLAQSRAFLGLRTVSSPASDSETMVRSRASGLPPSTNSTIRSSSGSRLGEVREKNESNSIIKKVNVSSGISQRIKALERMSSQSSRLNLPPPSAPTTKAASPFQALRKFSLRSDSRTKEISTEWHTASGAAIPNSEGTSVPTQDTKPTPPDDTFTQPDRIAPQPHLAGNSIREQITHSIRPVHTQTEQPDSLSGNLLPQNLAYDTMATGHHNVPSLISVPKTHSVEAEEPLPRSPPPYPSRTSLPSSPLQSPRPSLASARSNSSNDRSQAKSPRLSSDSSAGGMMNGEDGRESTRNSKKASRRSRLFRRVSSISNTSRRSLVNALSPAVKEEEPAVVSNLIAETKRASIVVGDINVQFPDNLKSKISAKRYHISDFVCPFAPDVDMQEMPNSVVLDFRDGSRLQCACESSTGQAQILSGERVLPGLLPNYRPE